MTRKACCDNCDATDDWEIGGKVIFTNGLLLQFRHDDGSEDTTELEVCPTCRQLILAAFPNLEKVLEHA